MFYNAKEGTLITDNMKLNYITFGNGDKPLVLIQGLNTRGIKGASFSLAYMFRIFTKEYKVYVFDRKENIPEGYTVRDIAKDVAAAMDKLKISRADVVGVSQGGMISQYLAIDRPDLVNKLVLCVTLSRNNETVKTVVNNWIEMAGKGDMKTFVKDMAEKMYSEEYVRRYKLFMPLLTIMQKPKDVKRFITLAKACLTCEANDELDKINCPVFVLGGKKDKVVTGDASEEIAEKLNCEIYMYENLGHSAYEEAKDFNSRIYEFLIKERID